MGWLRKPTWHLEYSWKRARILVAAAVCAVLVWRVAVLPVLRYLEKNTDWISADITKGKGFFNLHLGYEWLLASMVVVACIFASSRTEPEHRANPIFVAFAVMLAVVANFIFSPLGGLRFALGTALSLVPVVLAASCLVVRNVSVWRNCIGYGLLFWLLGIMSFEYFSDEEVAENWLHHVMYRANYAVNYSHYYAERAPERMYEHTVLALARAPQFRELGDWQTQLVNVVDSGANEDFLDFVYRTIGDADQTPAKMFDLSDDSTADDQDSDELQLSDAALRNLWMVKASEPGMDKNAYVVTDRQIMRCLTRVVSPAEKRTGIVFVDDLPVPDIALDNELLHCFDGQTVYRVEDNTPVALLDSPCLPLHGFGNYSADRFDVLVAFILRLWAADARDMREAARHFVFHGLNKELQNQILVRLVLANKRFEKGDVGRANVAVDSALELLQNVVLGEEQGAELSADKRAFLTSLFASYHARKSGDEELAREHDAACLEHRARWYENDPQAALLARTAVASESVATIAKQDNEQLIVALVVALGLTDEAQKDVPKQWSEQSFWLRKIEHDRTLIEQASAYFGTILDSFVSTRNQESEYETVRKMFAKSPDEAFAELSDSGIDITRYFLGAKHNGWCTYRLVLQVGEPNAEGKKQVGLHGSPRYCRVDDVLMSFDEDGHPAKKWDATGLPFHAPVVVGNAARLRGLSTEHRAQRTRDDGRDALLRLFLDQLTVGALTDVEALNLDLHPGARFFDERQLAAMERMRVSGQDVN